jgi:hypothetical protein
MNKVLPFALGAATVAVVLFIGAQLLGPSARGGVGSAPSASASPTPAPTASTEASASPVALSQSFTSTVHGISVWYPHGWKARAAFVPYTDLGAVPQFYDPGFDVLYHPTLTDHLFLQMVSRPLGDSTPADWVAAQMASDEGCQATEPITVDGAVGLIGAGDCKVAAITTAGRGYWIALSASPDDPAAVAPYDMAWFKDVVASVKLHPEDAVDSSPSASS